ncbi:hypothetical protein D3C72_2022580 [compost metagenome]
MVRIMARTLRSKAKSRSPAVMSITVPPWTTPAQLNRMSKGPVSATMASTAASFSTSSTRVSSTSPSAFASTARLPSASALMSVATTLAPARAKASALARPIP